MINIDLSKKLGSAFGKSYINDEFEIIIYPRNNTYFRLEDCNTEEDVIAKILEWCSRDACKETSRQCQQYLQDGIAKFIGKTFTTDDMMRIYTEMGNCVNHELTLRFIRSGYDMNLLEPLPDFMRSKK